MSCSPRLLAVIAWRGLAYWYIAAFGFSLALFGFFMNHTLRVLMVRYSRVASALMDSELGLGDYRRFVEGSDKKGVRGAWETLWSVHIAFVIFYAFAVGGWAALLTMTQGTIDWLVIFTFVGLTLSVTPVLSCLSLAAGERSRNATDSFRETSEG